MGRIVRIIALVFSWHFLLSSAAEISSQSALTRFKLRLHRRLEAGRVRKARDLQAETQVSASAAELPFLSEKWLTFWTQVDRGQLLVGTQEGQILLIDLQDGSTIAQADEKQPAIKAKAFTHADEQWFVVLSSSGPSSWIRFYLRVGRGLERRQTVHLNGSADFDLVTLKGVHYMVAISHAKKSAVALYHWTQTQIDRIAYQEVTAPRSVTCWIQDGSLYIAVAQDDGSAPVWLYNAKDENEMVLLQILTFEGPSKLLHFFIGESPYLIFVGKSNAALYWWTSDQFLLWQSIENTANAIDVALLKYANSEVLAIALETDVLYATLDASGQYFVTYNTALTGNVQSMSFWYTGQLYYALIVTAYQPADIFTVTAKPSFRPTIASFDLLNQCLDDVSESMDERETELNNINHDLNRVWLKDQNQNVRAPVIVTGGTTSQQPSTIAEVVVLSNNNQPPVPDSSLPEVEQRKSYLESLLAETQKQMQTSMLKSVEQDVTGHAVFHDSLSIPTISLPKVNDELKFNSIPLSRLNQSALRHDSDSIFSYPTQWNSILSGNVAAKSLNGIPVDDWLLLRDPQEVRGSLTFGNIATSDLSTQNINSIPIENIVTENSDQTFVSAKGINLLRAGQVDVSGLTNSEDLSEVVAKTITKEGDEDLYEKITFEHPLQVKGDIFLMGTVNGEFTMNQLALNTVNKKYDQELKGHYTFTAPTRISKDLTTGSINNIPPSNLLTLNTAQTIPGNMAFSSLYVDRDLMTGSVNGVDLSSESVLKYAGDQFVTSYKRFMSQVTADFVDMTEFVRLDGVDPSLLVQDIIKHEEGVVEHDATTFHNVVVSGNVTTTDGVNGYDIAEWPETYWLRSTPQEIPIIVTIGSVRAHDVTNVNFVDGLNLDTDLMHTYGDEEIVAEKAFTSRAQINQVQNIISINGVDIQSIREAEKNVDRRSIRGTKTFQNLQIIGDLSASQISNLDINNLLQLKTPQSVTGDLTFSSEKVSIKGDLKAKEIQFNTFGGTDMENYFESAFLLDDLKYRLADKMFARIQGSHLMLESGSTLNGISDMLYKFVTLNTEQELPGDITFLQPVHMTSATVETLNNRHWNSFVASVVVTNRKNPMLQPVHFRGLVSAEKVSIRGTVNSVDFEDLRRYAALKSGYNTFLEHIVFDGAVEIHKLSVGGTVDGVKLTDLVLTGGDELLVDVQLTEDAYLKQDMFITGHLNGCDLTKLGQEVLYLNKPEQEIHEKMMIESLQVMGNLNILSDINEVSLVDMQKALVSLSEDQVVDVPMTILSDFSVNNIQLAGANGLDLEFLFYDAVRKSVPQTIHGLKRFLHLAVGSVGASELFLHSSMNGVNLNEFYRNIVWKHTDQTFEGEKMYQSISAVNAIVEGYINGLSLPQDVVLTHTSEFLPLPVYLKSAVILGSDLTVSGRLDGVNLNALLENRVTLSGDEQLKSSWILMKDSFIMGSLNAGGIINDVVLDLVLKVNGGIYLQGQKTFARDLRVINSLAASSINGISLQHLNQSILRKRDVASFDVQQVFQKPLRVYEAFLQSVNSISLPSLFQSFYDATEKFSNMVGYYRDTTYDYDRVLSKQLQATGSKIATFAYFILYQEVKFLETKRILEGSIRNSLAAWSFDKTCLKPYQCCRRPLTQWLQIQESGYIVPVTAPEEGMLYPIVDPAPRMADTELVFWSNTTHSKWCFNEYDQKMYLGFYSPKTGLQTALPVVQSPHLLNVKSFRVDDRLYTVAGFYYDRADKSYSSAVVYVLDKVWIEYQMLPSFGVLSLDVAYYSLNGRPEILLAVGTGFGSYSTIYRWNDLDKELVVVQNIPSLYVPSVLWLRHGSSLLLVMANVQQWPMEGEDCVDIVSGGQVDIYVYGSEGAKWLQRLNVQGVVAMVSFVWDGETYIVAASRQLQSLYIYKWKGYSKFSEIQTIFVGEVRHIFSYSAGGNLYIALSFETGPVKVYKMIARGQHERRHLIDLVPPQDQAISDDSIVEPGC